MTRPHADYIYSNRGDTLRVRVHRRLGGRWDYDVFYPSGAIKTYSDEAGDDFATKREALAEANHQHGPLRAISVEGSVTDAAWYRRHGRPEREHAAKKTPASQLDREIAEALTGARPDWLDDLAKQLSGALNALPIGPARTSPEAERLYLGWRVVRVAQGQARAQAGSSRARAKQVAQRIAAGAHVPIDELRKIVLKPSERAFLAKGAAP